MRHKPPSYLAVLIYGWRHRLPFAYLRDECGVQWQCERCGMQIVAPALLARFVYREHRKAHWVIDNLPMETEVPDHVPEEWR
jgi:hypothetical protein